MKLSHRNRARRAGIELAGRSVLEALEIRQLLSTTYYVTPGGNDSAAGNASAPFATLQQAANVVQAGDTVDVAAGDYAGFQLSTTGTSSAPITFNGGSGVVVNGTPGSTNGEIDLTGDSYVTLNGFDVEGSHGARAGIWAGGYAYNNVNDVVVENSTCNDCTDWGFLGGFMNNSELLDDTFSNTQVQHGAYIGNSSNDDTVKGCTFFGNYACGFECNEDETQGGPGYGSGLVIDGNTFYDNANGAGASINFDGVQNSIIENNVIYDAQRNGIALYQINGADPSTGNTIVNNTIDVNGNGASGYSAISLLDGAADTTIYNNILSAAESSFSADPASQVGLKCDYNIFGASGIDPTGESYANNVTLSAWQAMGYDKHSIYVGSSINSLFVSVSDGNFDLASGSAAIGAGTSTDAPALDHAGNARPTSGSYDIGALQYDGSPGSSSGTGSGTSSSGSSGSGSSSSGSSSGSSSSTSGSSGSSSGNSGSSSSSSGSTSNSSGSTSGSSGSKTNTSGSSSSGSSGSSSSSSSGSTSDGSGSGSDSSGSGSGSSSSTGSGSSSNSDPSSGSGSDTGSGSESSTPPDAGPAAPTDLAAMAKWTGSIALQWADSDPTVASYQIERSTDGVTFDVIGTAGAGDFYYVDNTAAAGTQYTYEVVALDSEGTSSSPSNLVVVTPLASGDPDGEGRFGGGSGWQSGSAGAGPSLLHGGGNTNSTPTSDSSGDSTGGSGDGRGEGTCNSNNNWDWKRGRWLWSHWAERFHCESDGN